MSDLFDILDDQSRRKLKQMDPPRWVDPMLATLTDDQRLRHPRFLGLRRDKEAKDVVRERPESR